MDWVKPIERHGGDGQRCRALDEEFLCWFIVQSPGINGNIIQCVYGGKN